MESLLNLDIRCLLTAMLLSAPAQAFIKLESMPSIPAEDRSKYADLGMSIFMKQEYTPRDPYALRETRDKGAMAK